MPQPYNYMLNLPDPTQQVLGSVQLASAINQEQRARELALLQQQKIQVETGQIEAQQARTREFQSAIADLGQKPTTGAIADLMIRFPEYADKFKTGADALSEEQQKSRINQASRVYSALTANRPDMAIELLNEFADAYENTGDTQNAKASRDFAKLIEISPTTALSTSGMILASNMGPKEFIKTFEGLGERERAEQKLPLEKAKLAEEIETSKEDRRIKNLELMLDKAKTDLEREKLNRQLAKERADRDKKINTEIAEYETAKIGLDNSLFTIERLLGNPELDNILGAVEGSEFYPSTLAGLINPWADADVRADAQADLETIQSQAFLNNLMEAKSKGATFGSLTEREGERLVGYVRNLKTKQSEKQFRENLNQIAALLKKSRTILDEKYGSTVETKTEETPGEPTLDDLLAKYGG